MSSKQLVALGAAAAALAATGCGGSSSANGPLTKSQLIARADPICAHFFIQLHAHGTTKAGEFAGKLRSLLRFERTETAELRKLTPPASMSSDWEKMLALQRAITADSARLLGYAERGRLPAAQSLLAATGSARDQAVAIAQRDGFKDCARTS